MHQEFNATRNVYVNKDSQGKTRELLHFDKPVVSEAHTPQLIAFDYLKTYGDLLGISLEQLNNLSASPSQTITDDPIEYRLLDEKQVSNNAVTVAFHQTDLGLPVWQAGVAINMKTKPMSVLSATSTLHHDLKVDKPSAAAIKRLQSLDKETLSRVLGLAKLKDNKRATAELKIESNRLLIYRYESAKRLPQTEIKKLNTSRDFKQEFSHLDPTLPLPSVPEEIKEGMHYVSAQINFSLPLSNLPILHWIAIVEAQTLTVLYLRAFVADVNGFAFQSDPVTSNGGPLPTSNNTALNPVRTSILLSGLNPPASGTQSLVGNFVAIQDVELPTIAPPTEPSGNDFNFDARTDNFAAVNAYYHCDRFFRMMQDDLGFNITNYFGGTTFPTPVDHRGRYGSTDGIEINAHCVGTSGGNGIDHTSFMLADTNDTSNPLGLACDFRVALHELAGHGTLYNHVNSPNFGFSHSAGDSVAVILNDPGSQAADRFQSFPWMYSIVSRRHDRDPASGWGYGGSIALNPFDSILDRGGYNNEQILSTTLFRLYRSLGGDSGDINAKQFASRYTVYLILRAIASLTPATNPSNASGFATALMTADLVDWTSAGQVGGAYGKVIRWAFEKQGLYQPMGTPTPNNNLGSPPAIDVYIDDGRSGEYQYQGNFWSNQNIWNRVLNDGGTTHQDPIVNQTNYAYVKIKNRGSQTATNVIVQGYHANPSIGLNYPNDWQIMTTPALAVANVPPNNSGEITVGPFEWTPTHIGHECIFMIVSCPGDASNASNIAAGDSIPEWRLVPNDNNIGQRNVAPVAGGGQLEGLVASFERLPILLKNPGLTRARMIVQASLPAFLIERGWKMNFINPGGDAFTLGPGETAQIHLRLAPGKNFTTEDVRSAKDKTIHVMGYADGILLGGMSYQMDPNLKKPSRMPDGKDTIGKCADAAKDLLDCLKEQKMKKVRIRKINLDIEFEDDDTCCKDD